VSILRKKQNNTQEHCLGAEHQYRNKLLNKDLQITRLRISESWCHELLQVN